MDDMQRLMEFFQAENRRDWGRYRSFLDDKVEWTLHGEETQRIAGAEAYLERIQAAYAGNTDTFRCEKLWRGGGRITALLVNSRGDYSLDLFEFEDGRIRREVEVLLGKPEELE